MDQLKLHEIKNIFRFLKKEGDTKVSFSNRLVIIYYWININFVYKCITLDNV